MVILYTLLTTRQCICSVSFSFSFFYFSSASKTRGRGGKVNFHDVLQRSIQAFIIFFLLKSRGKFVFERACINSWEEEEGGLLVEGLHRFCRIERAGKEDLTNGLARRAKNFPSIKIFDR